MPQSHEEEPLQRPRDQLESTPYWRLLGVRVEELGHGHCCLRMTARPEIAASPGGPVHTGALACLAELAVITAAATLDPSRLAVASASELHVTFLASVTGDVLAEARAAAPEGAVAHGEVRIRDARGHLLATGSATCSFGTP